MNLPLSRIISTVLAISSLVAIAFKTYFPGDDPYRCRALQNTGRWIDPPDEEGHRYPFRQWQPDGCILHEYDSSDIRQCTEGRRIVIVGDSTSRNVAYAISRLINRKQLYHHAKHKAFPNLRDNFNITYDGQVIQRLSNVYLGSHGDPIQEEGGFVQNLDIYADEKKNSPSIEIQEGPALIYIAEGLWFTHPSGHETRKEVLWDTRFGVYKDRMNQLIKFIGDNTPGTDPFVAPMDPYDGIGNQIFYAPPAGPRYQGDDPERIEDNARRASEVIDMHDWLHDTEDEGRIPILWSTVGVTTNQNKTWIDPLEKAAHVIEQVAETRANIILNMRCNAKLDRMKPYPYARTCCTDYGGNQYSIVVVGALIYLAACVICEILDLSAGREPRWRLLNMEPGSIILALLMCYFADRTQMVAKGSKLWQIEDLALLCLCCVVFLLITIRSRSRLPAELSSTTEETSEPLLPIDQPLMTEGKDEPFLSREQTEEWKGWMQCFVVIYQWTGADKGSISLYILFRLCVAAYLFQTGYGHTLYFIKTNDFSFNRVAATLLRLNTLSCALAYFMNTDYMFYYSAPLASFWFLIIYTTMAIGKKYNSDSQVVLAKVCLSCILVSAFFATPFTQWTFDLLKVIFNIQWSDDQWTYHVTLDIYVVYVGMITAIVHHEMGGTLISMSLRLILGLAGLFAVFHYFSETSKLKNSPYDTRHPYISVVPVLVFVALRNISTYTRNYHSTAMVWIGRCSLEMSLLQSHILLAADREGVLIVDGLFGDGTVLGDRWRTLLIIVPIFIWICYAAKSATAYVIELVLYETPETEKLGEPAFAWLNIPGGLHLAAPKVRVACILLVMWLFNLLSPGHEDLPLPPGGDYSISRDYLIKFFVYYATIEFNSGLDLAKPYLESPSLPGDELPILSQYLSAFPAYGDCSGQGIWTVTYNVGPAERSRCVMTVQ
ncbi:hypothetical protein FSARC_4148 [Fusarium sarcochroum]|uniref:Cas1p 10 TM acyl transferase domain-containing protein n=1 Tax=Fusarium sarcochroum TaxID=1208366 RepID=A0A8H4U2T8_9HYPO|nr:hypothetical protein FSARC_4148 [Fusarium sarcochroum]